jgi:hypothetical protein
MKPWRINFFSNEDPIGRRIAVDMTSYAPRMTIVGIVGDIRMDGMDSRPLPEVFWPMAQLPSANAWLVARTRGDPGSVANALDRIVHDIDPEIAIVESSTMTSVVADSLWRERFSALLVGLFAVFAVIDRFRRIVRCHFSRRPATNAGIGSAPGARRHGRADC